MKCDDGKPECLRCSKSGRTCRYAQTPSQDIEQESLSEIGRGCDSTRTQSHSKGDRRASECTVDGRSNGTRTSQATQQSPNHQPPNTTIAPHFQVTSPIAANHEVPINSGDCAQVSPGDRLNRPNEQSLPSLDLAFSASPLSLSQVSSLDISLFEWYDLLARDAINQIQRLNDTSGVDPKWKNPEITLSRRQSPAPECPRPHPEPLGGHNEEQPSIVDGETQADNFLPDIQQANEPWNTATSIKLSATDLPFFRYYVEVVGPILDLFDPARHFSNVVPHLALRNIGLLKSILAVGARHMSLGLSQVSDGDARGNNPASDTNIPTPLTATGLSVDSETSATHLATQYYYETLQYLSQTLFYPSYADSHEILATATMISTYEMFDTECVSSSNVWEQHLRGSFWIQRCQDNDGESLDGLRQAVWWAWLRQDIWAAFQVGRPTITFWRARKHLEALTSDELATRIVYICGKCVKYASSDGSSSTQDPRQRIEQGDRLLRTLDEWYRVLPASYEPVDVGMSPEANTVFPPIWVHPPNHAGAIQMYHFSRAIVLLNQPSMGGLNAYVQRDKQLDESVRIVCGIANACQDNEPAIAFVNVQALYGGESSLDIGLTFTNKCLVGQYVRSPEMRDEILRILARMLRISKFPGKGLSTRLQQGWQE